MYKVRFITQLNYFQMPRDVGIVEKNHNQTNILAFKIVIIFLPVSTLLEQIMEALYLLSFILSEQFLVSQLNQIYKKTNIYTEKVY
jgi:hypothetical protein